MANTYSSLHYHIIFSTKNREPWIVSDIERRIWAFLGGIARKHKMAALQVGGVEDHIHALVTAPTTIAPFQIAQYLKAIRPNGFTTNSPLCGTSVGKTDMLPSL